MKFCAVFVITVVLLAGKCRAASDKGESLFSEAMRHMSDCSEKIDIDMGVCSTMLEDDVDRSDPKYDNCKAMGVCMSERFGIMVGNDYDYAKMEVHKQRIDSDEYKAEADKVLTACKGTTVGPSQNESVVNIATCALKASPKFKEIVTNIAKSFSSSD